MPKRLIIIYGIVRRLFGYTFRPILTGILIITLQLFGRITFWLDNIFFSGYRRERIEKPIFIIGNPRSGTTLLHRFLFESKQVTSFRVWEMIVPSILGQKLLRPFIPSMAHLNPGRHYISVAHETGLTAVETDEVLLSFRFFDGLFVLLYFHAWSEGDHIEELIKAYAPGSAINRRDISFYRRCLLRNIYSSGKERFLGKPFMFALRLEDVLKEFPDAKFIYMVRDPIETIPSGINMLYNAVDRQFNIKRLDPAIRGRYYRNLYKGECELYRRFYEYYKTGRIPEKNLMIIRYPDLMQNFEKVMDRVLRFTELKVPDWYMGKIREQGEKQRRHESRHEYDLTAFGLTPDQIRRDLDFVYREFEL